MATAASLLLVSALLSLLASLPIPANAHPSVPAQYFYEPELASSFSLHEPSGCELRSWDGTDEDGISGYPWVTTVVCPEGKTFRDSGLVKHGHVRIFLWSGELRASAAGGVARTGPGGEGPSPDAKTSAYLNLTGSA